LTYRSQPLATVHYRPYRHDSGTTDPVFGDRWSGLPLTPDESRAQSRVSQNGTYRRVELGLTDGGSVYLSPQERRVEAVIDAISGFGAFATGR
jgi:hypothetical protein